MRNIAPLLLLVAWLLSACSGITSTLPIQEQPQLTPTNTIVPASSATTTGVQVLVGDVSYTGGWVSNQSDNAVMLVDLHGFVMRDHTFEPRIESQVLGAFDFDDEQMRGSFRLNLPIQPSGNWNDVDQDGQDDQGILIFNLYWWSNEAGNPFASGDDQLYGWASIYASTRHDSNSDGEINGGRVVVWAPDTQQGFPTGYGSDGLLFTADDPIGPLEAGYSVIDLTSAPFTILRSAEVRADLYEPEDYATQDYSELSYTAAFNRMAERVRATYAFNGIEGKQPDWDALIATTAAAVERAEREQDAVGFFEALQAFTYSFRDGHVALDGGDLEEQVFDDHFGGGYGFAARELDDGHFVVTFVLERSDAEEAGMQVGAELIEVDGEPTATALTAIQPFSAPYSTEAEHRYQQVRYLLRDPIGTRRSFTFINPRQQPTTVTIRAFDERESFESTSIYAGLDGWLWPVESWYLDGDVGNILVATNSDDIPFTLELFERALQEFEDYGVPGLIIDLRQNDGGSVMGLAGFFSEQPIPLAQEFQRDTTTGEFEPRGAIPRILPRSTTYKFDEIIVLVGFGCASACEAEAYALSQLENVTVLGQYPSSGMYAAVIGEEYLMPEGISMQFSKWRYQNPDGSLFLEGEGVVPAVQVPITLDTVTDLEENDPIREAALAEILE
ncbi:MAG: hypothetical protein Fur005_46800 [Roseiflexaceae bacterium]